MVMQFDIVNSLIWRHGQAHLRRPLLDLDAVVEGIDADGSGLIDSLMAWRYCVGRQMLR